MQRNIKLAIAAAILVGGLSAALLFRRDSSAVADNGASSAETLPHRVAAKPAAKPATAVTFPAGATAVAAPPKGGAVAPWSSTAADNQFGGSPPAAGRRDAIPTIPPHYDPSGQPSSPRLPAPPSTSGPVTPAFPPALPAASPQSAPPPLRSASSGAASLRPPLRTHRIADGDTLGQIANHYLGDAARQKEILDLNHDVLGDNPDLLPIGAVLKVPAPASTDQGGSSPGITSSAGLVPIPPGALHH